MNPVDINSRWGLLAFVVWAILDFAYKYLQRRDSTQNKAAQEDIKVALDGVTQQRVDQAEKVGHGQGMTDQRAETKAQDADDRLREIRGNGA